MSCSRTDRARTQCRYVFSVQKRPERAGCTITRTRVSGETEVGGRPAGAFEALLELLSVNPQLSGNREAHATGLVIFHSDRSGRSVEANGGKAEIRLSTRCTPGGSGGQPSWQRTGSLNCKSSAQTDGSSTRS